MLEGATRITNLDRENMLRPIDLDRLRKYNTKKKKKACQVENPKGWPRQKLRQRNPARLKTQKGNLGERQRKRPWTRRKFPQGHHGKNYMAQKKEKKEKERKEKKKEEDNKQR